MLKAIFPVYKNFDFYRIITLKEVSKLITKNIHGEVQEAKKDLNCQVAVI